MQNNSTMTAQDLKDRLLRLRDNAVLDDNVVIDALNDFYSEVQRAERSKFSEKNRTTSSAISITSGGYDLSGLSDIGQHDIRVYKGQIKTGNILTKRFKGSTYEGYYVEGDMLYLTPDITTTESIYISYPKKTTRVDYNITLSTHTLQIDQDLERATLKYLEGYYFDVEYEYDKRDNANQIAQEEIARYFSAPINSRSI